MIKRISKLLYICILMRVDVRQKVCRKYQSRFSNSVRVTNYHTGRQTPLMGIRVKKLMKRTAQRYE